MVKRIKNFEFPHEVLAFLVIMILTILFVRGTIYYIIDPDLKFSNFEIHHFDYGLIILIVTSLLLLFGRGGEKHFRLCLVLTAISLGLIVDELWFIRKQVGGNNPELYNPSFVYVVFLAIGVVLTASLISYLARKK